MLRLTRMLLCAVTMLAGLPALAQTPTQREADPAGSFAFLLENDTFSGNDRYYTNGFLFAWRAPSYDPPAWLGRLTDGPSLFFPGGGVTRWGLSFGQKIFTPEDTLATNPDPQDRPYAAWLYGAVTLHAYNAQALGTLELQVGVVGPSALGEWVQNTTHDMMRIDRAYGWDYQIHDEPGVNLVANRQWRLNGEPDSAGRRFGWVPSLAASLGNVHTYAAGGVLLRYGTELEADFGPPRVRPVSAGSVFFQPTGRFGWYVFGGVEGRAVARDISLDGNTWRDSRSVDRETLVGDASAGLALIFESARLTATYTIRSKEFETQREAAQFGSISIAFRF